ncbi:CD166 antigen homolog A-like isoform X1 [Eucyclogobius newberryi]|uniref:CD166 antigen homolog A-like isoform X1 n=1 Tax=Eucyclogobius newberryi TaxID=166745 RepID=UPI003B5A3208
MMHLLSAGRLGAILLLTALLSQVSSLDTVFGLYGQTLEIPCYKGAAKAEDILMTKWKYDKGDGLSGNLLVKKKQNVSVSAEDEYKNRVSLASNSSLLLSEARLSDQRTFTCMLVFGEDIEEHMVNVVIYKTPLGLEITEKAEELEIGKQTKLGKCVAQDANPAVNITWLKNNKPLQQDGQDINIQDTVQVDPETGLSTTTSVLMYSAQKEDTDAQFSCSTEHSLGQTFSSSSESFTITYSTENIMLRVIPPGPLLEGANVTLKCEADGNPAPTSFNFHLKGKETVIVENDNSFTITNVSRDTSGEYKCSLIDNPTMEAAKDITVNYLDISLSPMGSVEKNAGETLAVNLKVDASGEYKVSWTKDKVKLDKEPQFTKLTYSDAGLYEYEVTMGELIETDSFELIVQGPPVIKQLLKQRSENGRNKVLICEAEGSPKPAVTWSINGTSSYEGPFINGKITHKITVVPTANLTVSCTVSNDYGVDMRVINVSSLFEEVRMDKRDQSEDGDQTKLVVGVVVGLLVAALVIGLAYWVYMRKSKQGSWKTGEKECGSSEEEKKLEEKVEENSQKAEV